MRLLKRRNNPLFSMVKRDILSQEFVKQLLVNPRSLNESALLILPQLNDPLLVSKPSLSGCLAITPLSELNDPMYLGKLSDWPSTIVTSPHEWMSTGSIVPVKFRLWSGSQVELPYSHYSALLRLLWLPSSRPSPEEASYSHYDPKDLLLIVTYLYESRNFHGWNRTLTISSWICSSHIELVLWTSIKSPRNCPLLNQNIFIQSSFTNTIYYIFLTYA